MKYDPVDNEKQATHVRIPLGVWKQAFELLLELPVRTAGVPVNALLAHTTLLRERAEPSTSPPAGAPVPANNGEGLQKGEEVVS